MLRYFAIFCLLSSAFGQNPHNVIAGHPRILMNDTVADTWQVGLTRFTAIVNRMCGNSTCSIAGTSAGAHSSWNTVLGQCPLTGAPSMIAATDEGSLGVAQTCAFIYAVKHKLGDSTADQWASLLWNQLTTGSGAYQVGAPIYHVNNLTTNSTGTSITLTLASAVDTSQYFVGATHTVGIWGVDVTNDVINCSLRTITAVSTDGLTVTLSASGVPANLNLTESGVLMSMNAKWVGSDSNAYEGAILTGMAYFYDWCYDWLVANGHLAQMQDMLINGYWGTTPTRKSALFGLNIRESDFHNYSEWTESPMMSVGIALQGDVAFGETILEEGIGYYWGGLTINPDTSNAGAYTYTFNIKKSVDLITGGAGNWEGPEYWRNSYIRAIRAIEEYDTGTGRSENIWNTQYSTVAQAAWNHIYMNGPNHFLPIIGDTHAAQSITNKGTVNWGLVIINDRKPDGHFLWLIDQINNWNAGSSNTGDVYKCIFYPWTGANVPVSHDPTDLPLGAQFGQDVFMRTGWGNNDTYIWFTGSIPGTTHRPWNAGDFGIYKQPVGGGHGYLVTSPAYGSVAAHSFNNWHRRSIASSTIHIDDPASCWTEYNACGFDHYSNKATNDSGQRDTQRQTNPPFVGGFNQLHLWSGTTLSQSPLNTLMALTTPVFKYWSGIGEYASIDLTSAYTIPSLGSGDISGTNNAAHPTAALSPTAPGTITRELVHFQPSGVSTNQDYVVIHSRVTGNSTSFTLSDIIHTSGPMSTYNGTAWTTQPTGINSVVTPQAIRSDNGTARLYVKTLLPSTTTTRVIGGSHAPIPLTCANSTNTICTCTPDCGGMQTGDDVSIYTGAYTSLWGTLDAGFGTLRTAVMLTTSTFQFSPAYNSSALTAFASAYTTGHGAPATPCPATNVMYWDLDSGQPYRCKSDTTWDTSLVYKNAGGVFPIGFSLSHYATGDYEGWVDRWGTGGGYNLLTSTDYQPISSYNTNSLADTTPGIGERMDFSKGYLDIQAPAGSLSANFLEVLQPTNTSVGTPTAVTSLTSTGWEGARIDDPNGTCFVWFPSASTALTNLSYTTTYSGTGKHIIAGLAPGSYPVAVGGSPIAGSPITVGVDGTLAFATSSGVTVIGGGSSIVVTVTTSSLPSIVLWSGISYNQSLAASGGTAPYTWAITGGALPTGLSMSSSGVITGVPLISGTYNFTVTATDTNGVISGGKPLSILVSPPNPSHTINGKSVRRGGGH